MPLTTAHPYRTASNMLSTAYSKPVADSVSYLDDFPACESMTESALRAWMESSTLSRFAESMCGYNAPLPPPPSEKTHKEASIDDSWVVVEHEMTLEEALRILNSVNIAVAQEFTPAQAEAWRVIQKYS